MPVAKVKTPKLSQEALEKRKTKIDALNEEAWELNRKNPKAARETADEALRLSRKTNYKKGVAYALRTLGACSVWQQKNSEAMACSVESISLLKELGEKSQEAQVHYNIGANFFYMADYDNAFKHSMQSFSLYEEVGDQLGMAEGLNGMATVYYVTGDNDKALEYLERALKLSEEVGDTVVRAKIFDGMGETYCNLKQYDKAISCMFKSLEFTRMSKDNEQIQGFALDGIGRLYAIKGDHEKALTNYNMALAVRKLIGHKPGQVITHSNIGKLYFKMGKNSLAELNLKKALNMALKLKYKEGICAASEALSLLYERTKRPRKALEMHKKFHLIREELLRETDTKKSRSVEQQFRMEQVEKERRMLQRKNKDLESYYKDITLLSEIGQKIISSLSVEVIVDTVYENVNALMDATGFGIGIYEKDKNHLLFPLYIEGGERTHNTTYDLAEENRLASWCFRNNKEIFINDFKKEVKKYVSQIGAPKFGKATEALIYLPITVKDKIMGVITVQSFSKNAYSNYHLNMLRNLAVYTGIALENAGLYKGMEGKVEERTREIVQQKEAIERSHQNTELLGDIGRQITSTLDFDTIFTNLYENVNKLMDAACFGVRLYHPDKNQVEYKFEIENGYKYPTEFISMEDGNNLTVWCIRNKKVVFINDYAEEYKKYAGEIRVVGGDMPHSIVFVPMMMGDRVIGAITAQSFKKNAYTTYDLHILQTLCNYTATALENANLYNDTRLLSTIAKDISSSLSVETIVSKVYQNVNTLMSAECFGIGILNPKSESIEFRGFVEKGEVMGPFSYKVEDRNRLAVWCFSRGEEIFINDFSTEYTQYITMHKAPVAGQDSSSIMYLPLVSKEKVIGVITVQSFSKGAYTNYHLNLLRNLAVSIGIALDNASLYENLEDKVEDTKLLGQIAKDITSSLSVETIISHVYENVNTLMSADSFGIGLYNPATQSLQFPGFIERNEKMPFFEFFVADKNRFAVWCFDNEKEIFVNELGKEYNRYIKGLQAPVAGSDPESVIYLPLFTKDKKIGVITVQSFTRNAYTEYHLDILKNLAVSVAIALDNAGLYQNLETKVEERTAEVMHQKQIIEQKNKEITDSINYAQQIQQAILPLTHDIYQLLPDSFGLYRPKDVVSGDFYWVGKQGGKVMVAATDCTGHGVPGAFMSMLASNKLDDAIFEKKMTRPSDILCTLNTGIKTTLKQNQEGSLSRDGLDIALISINLETMKMEFAGANRPLLRMRNGEMTEIPPTKSAIGGLTPDNQEFANEEIEIAKGDCLYIFTDGYADQFGGEEGKKFMSKRFKELLFSIHQLPMKEQETILEKTFHQWRGSREQIDDILVIGIRI